MNEPISLRALLAGAGASALLAGCSRGPVFIDPNGATVAAAERHRTDPSAHVVTVGVVARPVTVDLAGREVQTWAYDDVIGGPGLRIRAGEILEVVLRNELPVATTIHWHGLAIRNGMDGVHDLTQPAVKPGATFTYRFTVPDPGTYWFHPHTGLQLDRGLYSPLIVDEVADPGGYDAEAIVVGIPNSGMRRLDEYSPFPDERLGGGDCQYYRDRCATTDGDQPRSGSSF